MFDWASDEEVQEIENKQKVFQDKLNAVLDKFKNRELKANAVFNLYFIPKTEAYEFIKKYHYLGDAKFFSAYNIGIYAEGILVGCATFAPPQGTSAIQGWVGEDNTCNWIQELTRLCVLPELNGTNCTSYLLGNAMKMLKQEGIRLVTTLADASRHNGAIYQVTNFKCYGLTDTKSDFIRFDGVVNPRGSTKNTDMLML